MMLVRRGTAAGSAADAAPGAATVPPSCPPASRWLYPVLREPFN